MRDDEVLARMDGLSREAALAMDRGQAQRCADALAGQLALSKERVRFAMAADGVALEAGDVVQLGTDAWRIVELSDGDVIRFEAVRAGTPRLELASSEPAAPSVAAAPIEPVAVIVDGPPLPGEEDDLRPLAFAFAEPWTGPVTFSAGADATDLTVRGRVERPCAMGQLASALYPHVSGRWQEASVWVTLPGMALASRSESAVLNGANAALVETEAGWELIQYREAELVDVETYQLNWLLRGQQGSDDAMAAGAAEGSRILFLTGAEQRLDVATWERSLELEWRAWRDTPEDDAAWNAELEYDAAAARMWSPAHLSAQWSGDDLQLSWIRRARKNGDAWMPGEPPHETAEAYRARVSNGGGVLRHWDIAAPVATYAAADQATDFPSGGTATIEVAQLGVDGEPGGWATLNVVIPSP